ncbi:MAG: hypothetical protein J6Y20_10465, partial [Lachnospiraceae bacterium]|nr:hypothetical protein [Lachnospiraceae bacterium]
MKATTYFDLVKKYSTDPTVIYDLATATVFAVTKKIVTASGDKTVTNIRRDLATDLSVADRLENALNGATNLKFKKNGSAKVTVVDPALNKATNDLINHIISDGMDLVHDAVVEILEQTAEQKKRDPDLPTDLERPFPIRRRKRKVVIKDDYAVGAWETVVTTPIQEVYKAVRRSIMDSRAVQTASLKYCYIDDISTDPDGNTTDRIYRRLDKYSDLATDPYMTVEHIADGRPHDATPWVGITTDGETV